MDPRPRGDPDVPAARPRSRGAARRCARRRRPRAAASGRWARAPLRLDRPGRLSLHPGRRAACGPRGSSSTCAPPRRTRVAWSCATRRMRTAWDGAQSWCAPAAGRPCARPSPPTIPRTGCGSTRRRCCPVRRTSAAQRSPSDPATGRSSRRGRTAAAFTRRRSGARRTASPSSSPTRRPAAACSCCSCWPRPGGARCTRSRPVTGRAWSRRTSWARAARPPTRSCWG